MDKIPYMTERIVNFKELRNTIEGCYIMAQFLKKESPHKESFEPLIEDLKKARDFQFEIEVKKINYCGEEWDGGW